MNRVPACQRRSTFSGANGFGCDASRQSGIDAAAQSDGHALESALAHIVASAKDQGGVGAGFFSWNLLVNFAGELVGVEVDQIFFEGLALGDDFAGIIQHEAGAVKDQAVIAADLVDHDDRHLVVTGDGGQHLAAEFALAHPKGRGGNVEHEVAAGLNQ